MHKNMAVPLFFDLTEKEIFLIKKEYKKAPDILSAFLAEK